MLLSLSRIVFHLFGCLLLLLTITSCSTATTSTTQTKTTTAANIKHTNLVNAGEWRVGYDSIGSNVTMSAPENMPITADFVLAKKKKNKWPYIELIYSAPVTLGGVQAIEITYIADTSTIVKLSQADFSKGGDKSYAHYQAKLPASTEWKKTRIELSEFQQPDWAPKSAKGVPLNLSRVDAIYFAPDLSQTAGGKAKLQIQNLTLY